MSILLISINLLLFIARLTEHMIHRELSYKTLDGHRQGYAFEEGISVSDTLHATTIVGVRHKGKVALAGDGQVTFGNAMIMKHQAKKVRRLYQDKVLAGFAGSVADAFTLFERFEAKLEQYRGNLQRAAVELAKEWRSDRVLRRLEAMLIVADLHTMLVVSGTGEVIEPDDGVVAIGSGGPYALAAARALVSASGLSAGEIARQALTIAADICIYTNHHITVEEM